MEILITIIIIYFWLFALSYMYIICTGISNGGNYTSSLYRKCRQLSCTHVLLFPTLCQVQLVVDSVACNELRVSSLFRHLAIVYYDDFVGVLNGREPMSYNKACTTNLCLVQSFLHHLKSVRKKRLKT